MKKVIVGMSGGVDSAVSALLLKEQGYEVIGLFMKNWEEADASGVCLASKEYEDVIATCNQLEIPYYSVNFTQEYRDSVFQEFLDAFKEGLTPNPDILCNREIKFKVFLQKALELGGDFLATGHYCRTDGKGRLLKGIDPEKDQSYFLSAVKHEALKRVLFPVGSLYKKEVRTLARKANLPVSDKKDSTGICFIGKRDFKPFLSRFLGYEPGYFETLSGEIVGKHDGVAYYTLGQRKGMGLGGEGDAWYVVGKDLKRNVVIVERGADHPALFSGTLQADTTSWIADLPPQFPLHCQAKIRYRQTEQECVVEQKEQDKLYVRFSQPQRAITPGQTIAFYDGEECLGSARILA
ncbi:MAG: tRNA 2-thiouridine(34) synthase MnmA [Chlamydiia bacterium]|nr:tRNA 2-thiouridine(34) synthase MnmA [Chlamydiia bacterium]